MKRSTQPHASGRFGAKTRSGAPCKNPPIRRRTRCRMHGGTSPGAPKGNRHAWKHGRYSAEAMAERRRFRSLLRELKEGIEIADQEPPIPLVDRAAIEVCEDPPTSAEK